VEIALAGICVPGSLSAPAGAALTLAPTRCERPRERIRPLAEI